MLTKKILISVAVIILGGMAVRAEAGQVVLAIADFSSDGVTNSLKNYSYGYITGPDFSSYGCLVAPIKFPTTPSKLKSGVVYVEDDNGTYEFRAGLYGVDMVTGAVDYLGYADSYPPNYSTSIQKLTINITAPKLNKDYQYYFAMCIYGDQLFYGVEINY